MAMTRLRTAVLAACALLLLPPSARSGETDWFRVRLLALPVVSRAKAGELRYPARFSRAATNSVPVLVKEAPGRAVYLGLSDVLTNGVPASVSGERIHGLAGIRFLRVDWPVEWIPEGLFAGSADLETVQFDGPVRLIAPRAFADSPRLSCVVLYEAVSTEVAPDAFSGTGPNLTCVYPFQPTVAAMSGDLVTGGLLWSRISYSGGDCRNRPIYVDGDFIWAEEGEGAIALKYIGTERPYRRPLTLAGRKVVAFGAAMAEDRRDWLRRMRVGCGHGSHRQEDER